MWIVTTLPSFNGKFLQMKRFIEKVLSSIFTASCGVMPTKPGHTGLLVVGLT